jgi:hypothetical protein
MHFAYYTRGGAMHVYVSKSIQADGLAVVPIRQQTHVQCAVLERQQLERNMVIIIDMWVYEDDGMCVHTFNLSVPTTSPSPLSAKSNIQTTVAR